MEKAIVVLNGKNEGKTMFVEVAKKSGNWVWNLNYKNVISMLAHKVGWSGERNKEYYNFVEEFRALSNKYFNSEDWYIETMVNKFNKSEKANLLIIHSCEPEISKKLQETYNCYTINITTSEGSVENNKSYCKVLNCNDENFEKNIVDTIKIITN
jgi:hypothetical protein